VIPERRLRALVRRPASTVVLSRVLLMPQVCHGRPAWVRVMITKQPGSCPLPSDA
jgi:hypothetical protein